ncbi:hypothetical protein [Malacoplasma iowae]|uniref:Uncharacterized protein n=1 Tax=Malacoplasma iowae 695 TaxID=1048830 RepID=A0A9J7BZC8_MALIO|nr:hypothetical protein [Malacoplasma iowae]VEU63423.1 Uncharacterised protein [Mycoplasmopsis fermentans]EGZ31510.1 hypothetical protein GUU_01782 [Malacoplasma iowae 695]UYS84718.1 hypothetical protein EER00_05500 [Malacoplasma iowae 695]WPL35540.1 hypothetical protein QX180_04410 [Malacoplasma iowae]WPL36942.1 hypothetical protein QX179_00450 [Malacoplasma iowae]
MDLRHRNSKSKNNINKKKRIGTKKEFHNKPNQQKELLVEKEVY